MHVRWLLCCLQSPSLASLLAIALSTAPAAARAATQPPATPLVLTALQKQSVNSSQTGQLPASLNERAVAKPLKRAAPEPLASGEIRDRPRPELTADSALPTPVPSAVARPTTARADRLSDALAAGLPTADDLSAAPQLAGAAEASRLVALRSPDRPDRWFADWQVPLPVQQPAASQSQRPEPPVPERRPSEPAPLPLSPPTELPSPEVAPAPVPIPPESPSVPAIPETISVERFEFVGNTIFSAADFAEITQAYIGRSLSFADLLAVRSQITEYYTERGYITTGAWIPPQEFVDGVIQIQVVEGKLEEIAVNGTRRLNPNYIRSRLAIATEPPLNINRLREALQLLQLDPLIATLTSELSAGTELGANRLSVRVVEADSFRAGGRLDNNRSPSVGSFRRSVTATEANLLGLGDRLSASYGNTDGSDNFDVSYALPFSPHNGTLRFAYGTTVSRVIEEPFDILEIRANSRYYEVGVRQPLWQTPATEIAVGLNFSRQESDTTLLGIPFPFPFTGADDAGQVRISALRFYQEWTNRSERQVLAARSQFSLGVDWLGATVKAEPPDTHFFSWRGQGQWVRQLAPDALFIARSDAQWSDRSLPSLERFGLGGQNTVRGYRQDTLLTDNGILISAELRWPVLRWPEAAALLQAVPFADFGFGWNNSADNAVETNAIAGIGLGWRWQMGDYLSLRFDWGIPLNETSTDADTWQENGFYFSVDWTLF